MRARSLFVIAGLARAHQQGVNASIPGLSCAASVLALLLLAPSAHAANKGHLAFSSPEGCASEAEFKAAVATRGGHFDDARATGNERALRVTIAKDESAFRGSFQTEAAEGASTAREVHGATCQEVVEALAVVSAIELRGDDESTPASAAVPPVPTLALAPSAPTPAAEDEGRLRANGVVVSKKVEVGAGTLRFDNARALTLFAGGELGLLPHTVVPRYDLGITAANFVTTPNGTNYLNGLVVRLRASYLGNASYGVAGPYAPNPATGVISNDLTARLRGLGFGMSACRSLTYDTRALVALFCAEYAAGLMEVKVHDATGKETQSKSIGFGSAGFGVEGEYNLGSVFHVGLKLGADFLLEPLTAERPDGSEIFHSSQFVGYGMLGFGFHF